MNRMKMFYSFHIISLFIWNTFSQGVATSPNRNQISNNRVMIVSTPRGENSSLPIPSDDSERMKYSIKIETDTVFYSLKADIISDGVLLTESNNDIVPKSKQFKGNEIIFEIVPDIPKPNAMRLFTYMPGRTVFRYLNCKEGSQIKYKKIEVDYSLKKGQMPLLLCYVDDEQNSNEKLIDMYLKDNLISITAIDELQVKIIKFIEKGLFVYYILSDK